MERLKYLMIVVSILCNSNCKSTRVVQEVTREQYEVIKTYFINREDMNLFFKSLDTPSGNSTLSDLITYDVLNGSHDIDNKKFGVEFERIFNEEEIKSLQQKAQMTKAIKLDLNLLDGVEISKKLDFKTLVVSIPIISGDGKYALMYIESIGGGELIVFKKSNGIWKANYFLSDWIS